MQHLQTHSLRHILSLAHPSAHHHVRQDHGFAKSARHRAYIALGSNLGDRVAMIEKALQLVQRDGSVRVLRTSGLWETKAMYVLDQDKFVNGACEVETSLSPIELLDKLQSVENEMGRVKVVDKGPRNIDLDILLYDQEVFLNERLQVPHKLMLERDFVLRPLCELIPDALLPPEASLPSGTLREQLARLPPLEDPVSTLTPLMRPGSTSIPPPITAGHSTRSTRVMSIINITPDSFSDGGKNYNAGPEALRRTIKSQIASGATIFDIGGQSTRPGAAVVSESEELSRILPVIKLIRSTPEANDVSISVDTYQSSIARAAIAAGADIINDVSAGLLDPRMLETVADLGCTVCLMHMRGTPSTMNEMTSYPDGVVQGVGEELLARVRAAEAAGVKRWRIILDPGIGFAKTLDQNLELLRRLGELREFPGLEGMPWLLGTSRKAFIGRVTGVQEARERTWGTAATVAASIQGGADIIRVHDVKEMAQVTTMSDAIWRV
ncbi:folic acid synthesis protein-like protein [Aaosphaeria arxii CBS 175.79]|uniref:Folic acid synthesis protein FOL1 n=1 Tax=Aaosphaeria arxii CBS 175.79 TaxID=1450172 RepID=A0A6A5XML5_9PLEO|nr:folic acid synthesis protein-like protein [Aaosphaeria arxii CBS 175.79]KAF2014382.1 folic acid synthesis protein-like protein [Aaosphaeria arxii CBS 175.79]